MTLKDIALELLEKYQTSETYCIWEFSGKIEEGEKRLYSEVEKYKALIEASADAVEVVRCRDCKYYEWTSNRVQEEQTWWCYKHYTETGNNDYCSYGERKENGKVH